jgi:hypothetical protein
MLRYIKSSITNVILEISGKKDVKAYCRSSIRRKVS